MRKLRIDFMILILILLLGTAECWYFLIYSWNNANLSEIERNWLFVYNYIHCLAFSFWFSYVVASVVFIEKEQKGERNV